MAIVALKKSAWDQASGPQKAVARMLIDQLQLGTPAGGSVGGVDWFVWSDGRITPGFVENMAWVFSHLTEFTDSPVRDYPTTEIVQVEVPVRIQVEVEVFDFEGNAYDPPEYVLVWQDHPTDTELVDVEQSLGDRFTLAADANLNVAWFTARESLPAGWVPDDGGV